MRTLLLIISSCAGVFGCAPPCSPRAIAGVVDQVCLAPDAGALLPAQPFTLTATPISIGDTCVVSVDGGTISLMITGSICAVDGTSGASLRRIAHLPCAVPALPAGDYILNDGAGSRLTVGGADAGISECSF